MVLEDEDTPFASPITSQEADEIASDAMEGIVLREEFVARVAQAAADAAAQAAQAAEDV